MISMTDSAIRMIWWSMWNCLLFIPFRIAAVQTAVHPRKASMISDRTPSILQTAAAIRSSEPEIIIKADVVFFPLFIWLTDAANENPPNRILMIQRIVPIVLTSIYKQFSNDHTPPPVSFQSSKPSFITASLHPPKFGYFLPINRIAGTFSLKVLIISAIFTAPFAFIISWKRDFVQRKIYLRMFTK